MHACPQELTDAMHVAETSQLASKPPSLDA